MSGKSRFTTFVFSTTDFYGNLITLSGETWNTHVICEHPAMAGFEDLVQATIQDPYEICPSTLSSTGLTFASPAGVGPGTEGIRVLVNYADKVYEKGATSGKVQTAYPIDVIRYSKPNIGRAIYKKVGQK